MYPKPIPRSTLKLNQRKTKAWSALADHGRASLAQVYIGLRADGKDLRDEEFRGSGLGKEFRNSGREVPDLRF